MQFSVDYLSNQFIISFDQFNEQKLDFKLFLKDEKHERIIERFTKQSYEFKEDSEWNKKWKTKFSERLMQRIENGRDSSKNENDNCLERKKRKKQFFRLKNQLFFGKIERN